jgi:TRAP-type C4-dicarboxylate transport system substrate-binding protein
MRERWQSLSPDQKEKLREKFKSMSPEDRKRVRERVMRNRQKQ